MDQSIFFPEPLRVPARHNAVREAFATCERCPVRVECLEYALAEREFDYGIWGGLDAAERRRLAGRGASGRNGIKAVELRRVSRRFL